MKYATYNKYKPSPMAWLDQLPTHWNAASLRWMSKRYAGGTPDKGNEAYWEDGEIPWINSGAVNDGYITQPSELITREGFANSSAKWIPKDALVMALAGQGKTKGMVAQLGIPTTCNQSMAALIPDYRFAPRYLYYWLTANYQNIRNLAGGEARDGLNLEMLGSIPCPVPPVDEQQAIARFLDAKTAQIDALVAQKRQLIEKLKEKRQALIARTVTRGLPPEAAKAAGLEPNPEMKPFLSGWIDECPVHWQTWKISHGFGLTGSGTTPPSDNEEWYEGDIPWVTTGELRESIITDTSKKVSRTAIKEFSALKIFPAGSLAIAMYGATIGRLGIFGVTATTNQACCVLAKERAFERDFVFYWLQAFRDQIVMLATGGGQPNISQEKIRSLRIPCPSVHEQRIISKYLREELEKIDRLVDAAESAIERINEFRQAVITSAVTGKIDVRGLA
jgi:type I restriction enzyme, S subunit